jgi:putative transposase
VEFFNGKLFDELPGIEIFTTLREEKTMTEDYRQDYNQNRPHSSLGYRTPHEFKQNWHHKKPGLTTVLAH